MNYTGCHIHSWGDGGPMGDSHFLVNRLGKRNIIIAQCTQRTELLKCATVQTAPSDTHEVSHPFPHRVKTRGSCAHIWIRKRQTPELLKFRSTFLLSSLEFNFQITILQIEREGPEVPGQSKNRSQNDRGDSPPGSGSWFINRKENWCINDLGKVDCSLHF